MGADSSSWKGGEASRAMVTAREEIPKAFVPVIILNKFVRPTYALTLTDSHHAPIFPPLS